MQDLIDRLRTADPAGELHSTTDLDVLAASILTPRPRRPRWRMRLALVATTAAALTALPMVLERPGVVERAAAAFTSDSGLYHWVTSMSANGHVLRREGWEDTNAQVTRTLEFTDGELASETRARASDYGGTYREVYFAGSGKTESFTHEGVSWSDHDSLVGRLHVNFRDDRFGEDGREVLDGREYVRLKAERDFERVVVLVEEDTGRIVLTRTTTSYPDAGQVTFTERVEVFETLEDTPENRARLAFRGPR